MEPSSCQPGLHVGLASDPGRIRECNEDASLVWQFVLAQPGQSPLPMGLFIVADGMGGHAQGEQASTLALRLAAQHVIRQVCLPLLGDDAGATARPPINEVLEASMRIAHEALLHRLPDAGTTMTTALLLGDSVFVAHVGDSRAYLGERGRLHCLTQDHSIAARLVNMGQATPEEVATQRHILYKALGQGVRIEPDILYRDMERWQYLLVCSDGLWSAVPEEEVAAIVETASTPTCACRSLVARGNERGGDDNISVILVARDWPLPVREGAPASDLREPFGLAPSG
jgi:serine/threonine protein phosphatase PrpC